MCLDYGLNIQSYERSCDEHFFVQLGPPFPIVRARIRDAGSEGQECRTPR